MKILTYTQGRSWIDPEADSMIFDAVVRNLEIIGEAAKHLPESLRLRYPEVVWQIVFEELIPLKVALEAPGRRLQE